MLAEAMRKTFLIRNHHFTMEQFEQVMAFCDDEGIQKKWKAFTKKIDTETGEFSVVLSVIKTFLSSVLLKLNLA